MKNLVSFPHKLNLLLKKQSFSIRYYFSTKSEVQPWVNVENRLSKLRGELVLKEHSQVENYAVNLVRGYYRSTNKDAITKDSLLKDHGLDSVDTLELCVQMEDELGYIIEAETMPKFNKVEHFINFIKHIEAYKREHKILPQQKAVQSEENWDNWLPNGEKIKSKLFKHTKH